MGKTKKSWRRLYTRVSLLSLGLCLGATALAVPLDPVVRVTTDVGFFDIQLLPGSAPNTVANFLNYVDRTNNGYNDTFIHRVAPAFVVQGGGFPTSSFMDNGGSALNATHIPTDPPVANEFALSNIRGTVAMAKLGGQPNSATSEWFVNLVDNSANLNNTNGGYTVFGRVILRMAVVDAIANLPRIRTNGEGVPVENYTQGAIATQANLINITVTRLTGPRADFNNDSKQDLIWQNTSTGQRYIWLMNGTTRASSANVATITPEWDIVGSADFDRDGKSDLLWQNNQTGARLIWLMNGTVRTSSVNLPTVSTAWKIVGTGDFNRDGKPDIVWQHSSTGQRIVWLMNGTTFSSSVNLGTVAPVWNIVGVGDFNADVKPDLLWQNNSTGERVIWLMNGTVRTGTISLPTTSPVWNIAGAADMNGDAKPDILWQNSSTGQRVIWLMNGTTFSSAVNLPTTPPQWSIRNR